MDSKQKRIPKKRKRRKLTSGYSFYQYFENIKGKKNSIFQYFWITCIYRTRKDFAKVANTLSFCDKNTTFVSITRIIELLY